MEYNELKKIFKENPYIKSIDIGSSKLFIYYNNRSKDVGGGVKLFLVENQSRPEFSSDLVKIISFSETTSGTGVVNYSKINHRDLFSKEKLF